MHCSGDCDPCGARYTWKNPIPREARPVMAKSPTLKLVTQPPALPPRPPDSNKGNFGRVLVLAGSRGMSGAAVLTAGGALRAGAGLVRLATPADVLPIAAAANPCYMTAPLSQDDQGRCNASAADVLKLAEG